MGRIAWARTVSNGSWIGKVGSRVAFTATPDNPDWTLRSAWTGSTADCGNVQEAREIAEKMLTDFAEQTGITLPESTESEPTLAQDLVERLKGELRWFKDADTDQRRAEYVAVQALSVFVEWLESHKKEVDHADGDAEKYAAASLIFEMHGELLDAQEELGIEVEREGS